MNASLAALVVLTPSVGDGKGGSMQPRSNKDFRELIVKGERPEIAACLVAAIDYVRRNAVYSAIRWDDDASDRAIMRETESNGQMTRHVRLQAQLSTPGPFLASPTWHPMQISCEQPDDGVVRVDVKPLAR